MKENIKRLQKDEYVVLIILFEGYVTTLGRIFTDKLKDESQLPRILGRKQRSCWRQLSSYRYR